MRRLLVVTILAGLVNSGSAIDLSSLEFPSDDELVEAYRAGDISEDEMDASLDARLAFDANRSLDVWENALGNAGWYGHMRSVSMVSQVVSPMSKATHLQYRYHQDLSDQGRMKYRLRATTHQFSNIRATVTIERDYTGRERVRQRAVEYASKRGIVRQLTLGNFSERLGMGSAFGPHGKVLGRSSRLDDESFLVPDYGGGNGLFISTKSRAWTTEGAVSFERDSVYMHTTAAINISRAIDGNDIWVTLGGGKFASRLGKPGHSVATAAIGGAMRNRNDHNSLEVGFQEDAKPIVASVLLEGESKRENVTMRYSAWAYHDDFLDDAAGSKTGSIRHTSIDTTTDLSISTRRSGTEGGVVRSQWTLGRNWGFTTTFLVSSWKTAYTDTRLGVVLRNEISETFTLSVEFLQRVNNRPFEMDELREVIARACASYDMREVSVRGNLGITKRDDKNYMSIFLTGNFHPDNFGRLELWVDMRRLGISAGAEDYAYGYLRYVEHWSASLESAVKVATRYDTADADHVTPTVSVEVEWLL